MPLKAEIHCHVKIIGSLPFRPSQLERRLRRARGLGLDVLTLTEHIEVADYWDIYDCLESLCEKASGVLRWQGVTVMTGAEITLNSGQDILMLGSLDNIRELHRRLGRPRNADPPGFARLMDASDDLDLLRVGAHPCRRGKVLWGIGSPLKRLDALEVNANELSKAAYVQSQSESLGLPVLAGSDAHHWLQIGRVYNLLPTDQSFTIPELRQSLLQRKVSWQKGGLTRSRLIP
ncbi:MAG: hypothetical protein HPY50_19845 [Firmicutes bacterium]|nr:hypothetical protein [Bacillota bacterium]